PPPPPPSTPFIVRSPSSYLTGTPSFTTGQRLGIFETEIDGVRQNALQSWTQLKGAVAQAGVDKDWRALWTKMSGVVEPYMERMTEHLGSAINIALRQQHNRRMRSTPTPIVFYSNNPQTKIKRS
ncbi:hypothetical protein PENTCL1PPCAC_9977, partial [Pristionchus entomophagus]